MSNMRVSAIVLIFMCIRDVPGSSGDKIVGIFDVAVKSHFIVFEVLMKALAARGHQVVVLSHFPQETAVPNYTDIDISGSVPSSFDALSVETVVGWQKIALMDRVWIRTRETCRNATEHPKVREFLRSSDSFDLVITEIFGSECTTGFAHKFKAPLVNVMSSAALPWAHARIGNPNHPAYMPSIFLPYSDKMDFWQRLINALFNLFYTIGYDVYCSEPTSLLIRELFGDDTPSAEQLARNASLVLVNSHFSINWPRPAVPAFVEVGGMHIQKPKKLPQELQKFLDESAHGVVYFSLGSSIRVQTFPPEKMKALLDAFAALPERVLMKYTGEYLPRKPNNVMISKWTPQLAVLSHPKTKLFVSHGGLGSVQETVYAAVPVVGIPLFSDQGGNIKSLQDLGMAENLNYEDITKENLLNLMRKVIDDESYSESAKRVSARFRDRPMTALDTAVYWVEYVIRHRGAPHLRSAAADMPLYQYLLIDVIGFLLLVTSTSIYIVYWAVKTALRTVIGSKSPAPQRKFKRQ